MRILCLFSRHPEGDITGITKDLSNMLHALGHEITVVTTQEARFKRATKMAAENGYDVLRIKIGNLFDNVSLLEKFITTIRLPMQLYRGIKKFLFNRQYDLIITHTPNLVSGKLIRKLRQHFNCSAMLILWDIFPAECG